MKKIISFLLIFVILIVCLPINLFAASGKSDIIMTQTKTMHPSGSVDCRKGNVDIFVRSSMMDDFIKDLTLAISNCDEEFEVTRYNFYANDETFTAICNYIFYENPEFFNVCEIGCSVWNISGKMASIYFYYNDFADTAYEYSNCMSKITDAVNVLLDGVVDNSKLTDEQKALVLHDRLALWNQYGYGENSMDEAYSMYGALGNRVSVCQGYAMAYMYLLDFAGIENYYCSSEQLNHAWNLVYIDGNPYHVDVTWDDLYWQSYDNGAQGCVAHDNFLRSSQGIYETGHVAYDYNTAPTNKKYDNYFWQNSTTSFELVNNEIYYVDNNKEKLIRYSDKKEMCSVKNVWPAGFANFWSQNYTCLSSDGKSLFYSQPNAIYRFDLTANKSEKIFELESNKYESIYGFTYEQGKLICDINTEPPGNGNYYGKYQIVVDYLYDYGNNQDVSGDMNGDNKINNRDLGMLLQYINGHNIDFNTEKADVNSDGRINNKDFALLMQYINGWNVELS